MQHSRDARTSTSLSTAPHTMSRNHDESNATNYNTLDTGESNGSDDFSSQAEGYELDFTDLLDVLEPSDNGQLDPPNSETTATGAASFVVALFCDGFVCRHWTNASGWVEGFAQSYDATSRYFLDCLEMERLPDGLQELLYQVNDRNELLAELWDLRPHPTALCPLTSADLPRVAPTHVDGASVKVRHLVLRTTREPLVPTKSAGHLADDDDDDSSDQFPQLSSADLDALTNDELASLETDLLHGEAEFDILQGVCLPGDADELLGRTPALESVGEGAASPFNRRRRTTSVQIRVAEDAETNSDEVKELITPKGNGVDPSAPGSAKSSPRSFLSPSDAKAIRSQPERTGSAATLENQFAAMEWLEKVSTEEDTLSLDDTDWIVKNATLRSIAPYDHGDDWIKAEPSPLRAPTTHRKPRKPKQKSAPKRDYPEDDFLTGSTAPPIKLALSRENFDLWPDTNNTTTASPRKSPTTSQIHSQSQNQKQTTSPRTAKPARKPKRKSIKHGVKPAIDSTTTLPATHLFLTKLKAKRSRNYTIDELSQTSPTWMMMKHMNRFYQAALVFERRHAQFLQVNVERIMTANHSSTEATNLAVGSTSYIAMQLKQLTRPDQVIAAAQSNERSPAKSPRSGNTKVSGLRSPIAAPLAIKAERPHTNRSDHQKKSPPPSSPPVTGSFFTLFDNPRSTSTSPPSSSPPLTPGSRSRPMTWADADALDGEIFEF